MLHSLQWMGMRTWNKIRTKIGTLCERSSEPLRVNEHIWLSVIVKTRGNGQSALLVLLQTRGSDVLFEGPDFLNAGLNGFMVWNAVFCFVRLPKWCNRLCMWELGSKCTVLCLLDSHFI